MSTTTNCPPGRWRGEEKRRAMTATSLRWHAHPERLTLLNGHHVMATVTSNGARGRDARWLLEVPGWQWRDPAGGRQYLDRKSFATQVGAQVEADDIIEAAGELRT